MAKDNLEKIVGEWVDWKELREDFHTKDTKDPSKGRDSYELRLKLGMKCKQKPEYSNRDITFLVGQEPDRVDGVILPYAAEAETNVLEYTDKHFAKMLNMLGSENVEALYSQALAIKPYKAMNGEHNNIADIHNELINLQFLLQHKDDPKVLMSIKYYILSRATSKAGAESLNAYVVNTEKNTLSMFGSIIESKNLQLQSKFMKGKELDKEKIIRYAAHNIKGLKAEEIKEKNEKKRDDLKDAREKIYLDIAKAWYDEIEEE